MPYFLSESGHSKVLAFAAEAPPGAVAVPDEARAEVMACMAAGRQFRLNGARVDLAPSPAPFDGAVWDFQRQAWTDPIGADVRRKAQWRNVRLERDARLLASDWVVVRAAESGQPVPGAWTTYRQALRDVTGQSDPFGIAWPVAPA